MITATHENWKSRGLFIASKSDDVPSMKDIAREAGVSTMTVSRALRDDPKVAAATKAKITSVAGTLGYKNECEQCGSRDCTISVRVAGEPRKLFCGKPCLAKFYAE